MGGRVPRSDVGCGECARPQSGSGVVELDRSRSGACDRIDQSTTVRCVCERISRYGLRGVRIGEEGPDYCAEILKEGPNEEPLIPSGRNVVPRLSGAEFVRDVSRSQNGTPGHSSQQAAQGVRDPLDSLVPCESDHEEVSVFDSEENLLRNNSSTVPAVPLQNRFSPLVESPNVRERGSENLHVSSEDEFQERPNSGRQVVPRIDRTLHSVADNLPGDFMTQPMESLRAAGDGPSQQVFCIASDREDESGSDTESVHQVRRPRRLRLRWRSSVPEVPNVVNVMDNLGARSAHVSAHREVPARGLVQQLASRIGSVGSEGMFLREIRQQRWSPLNVPLLWAASGEDSVPVLDWLIEVAEPIAFHGGNINPGAALQTGWLALRAVMRSWGVEAREGLSLWLQSHGFAATTPGNHIGARAQE